MNKPLLLEGRRTCRDILRLTSWGYVSAIESNGRTIWIADVYRGDGKRFVVRADAEWVFGIRDSRSRLIALTRRRDFISLLAVTRGSTRGSEGQHEGQAGVRAKY